MELFESIRTKLTNLETQYREDLKEYDCHIDINHKGESALSFWEAEHDYDDLQKILSKLSSVNNFITMFPTKIQNLITQIYETIETFKLDKKRKFNDFHVKYNNECIEVMTSFWYTTTSYYKYDEVSEKLYKVKIEYISNTKGNGGEKNIGEEFDKKLIYVEQVIDEVMKEHR